jgi:hypothetical protein
VCSWRHQCLVQVPYGLEKACGPWLSTGSVKKGSIRPGNVLMGIFCKAVGVFQGTSAWYKSHVALERHVSLDWALFCEKGSIRPWKGLMGLFYKAVCIYEGASAWYTSPMWPWKGMWALTEHWFAKKGPSALGKGWWAISTRLCVFMKWKPKIPETIIFQW